MKIRTTWRRTAALLAAGALVLTACNGEEPDDTDEETTAEDTATDEETGTEEADGDMEVAIGDGITEEPCPEAVNPDNGCIYLGTLSDLTEGPFAALGQSITEAQEGFWARVNEEGGIAGFDVNVTEYVRDTKYNPEEHNRLYQEIKPDILALAQTLGSPTTAQIADDLAASSIVAAPASWTSALEFNDVIVESGNNYCVESSNALDYYVQENGEIGSLMAVHFPGDYGWDGAAGAKKWAEANDVEFQAVEVVPELLGGTMDGAVSQIVTVGADVVVLTVSGDEMPELIGDSVDQGYEGFFIGNSPTWRPDLQADEAFANIQDNYWQAGPWEDWDGDTPGHEAMREALADVATPTNGHVAGWVWSYPLKAALEAAAESGDLTRESVAAAVTELSTVDYEGTLPEEAGDFTGDAGNQSFRQTVIGAPDTSATTGIATVEDFFEGTTHTDFPFEGPCFVEEGFAG